ncbi:MAG: hypothetical protein ACOC4H_03145 [bacterium]
MEKHLVSFAQDKNGYGESFERSFDSWSKVLKFMLMKKMFISPLKENQMYHSEKMRAEMFFKKIQGITEKGVFDERRRNMIVRDFNSIINRRRVKMFIENWIIYEKGFSKPREACKNRSKNGRNRELHGKEDALKIKWGSPGKKKLIAADRLDALKPGNYYIAFREEEGIKTYVFEDEHDAMAFMYHFVCRIIGNQWPERKGYSHGYNDMAIKFKTDVHIPFFERENINTAKNMYNRIFREKPGLFREIISMGEPYEFLRADFFGCGKYMTYRVEPQFEELKRIIAECEFNDKNKKHMKMFCGYLKHISRKPPA